MGKYLDRIGLAHLIGKIKTALGLKQDTLVSGTNIKTVNNQSLLGSGNIAISGGSSLPSGGSINDVLVKNSGHEGDLAWRSPDDVVLDAFTVFSEDLQDEGVPYFMWDSPNSVHIEFRDYLPLSGGAVTGDVDVSGQLNVHEAISTICDTVDSSASDNGLTSTVYRSIGFRDSAQKYMGYIQLVAAASGYSQLEFSARKPVNGSNVDNAVRLRVAADGSRVVMVSAPDEWRAALGFNTWTTVSISNFATAASGWSFVTSECQVQYNAALGALRCRIRIKTSAAQTAGQKTVFTVKEAYRPKTLNASLSSLVSNAQAVQLFTTGGAAVNISALNASASLYFNGVYFIGA